MSELVNGLFFTPKKEQQPDFVLGNLSAKRIDLIAFLQTQSADWVNMQVLMSKAGKPWIKIDDWKPEQKEAMHSEAEMEKRIVMEADDFPISDDLPF